MGNYYIEEVYCSKETSALLNAIGFNGECHGYYNGDHLVKTFDIPNHKFEHRAPTIQVAHTWLRKVYDINIKPFFTEEGYFVRMDNKILPLDNCDFEEALDLGIQAIAQSIFQNINEVDEEPLDVENIPTEVEVGEDDNGKKVLKIKQ